MSTNQLLLVSTLGLGVNLFGMFAMGGHHHHHVRILFHYSNVARCHNLLAWQSGHSHSHGAPPHEHGPDVSDGQDHSHLTNAHNHSHSHSEHSHNHDDSHFIHSHTHSHTRSSPLSPVHHHHIPPSPIHTHKRTPSRMESLTLPLLPPNSIHLQSDNPSSPITPGYRFGQDDHFAEHHHSHHMPNSHDHSHHPIAHEGHSHNMRGVSLHSLVPIPS